MRIVRDRKKWNFKDAKRKRKNIAFLNESFGTSWRNKLLYSNINDTTEFSTLSILFHDKPIIFIDLDRSLTPAARESGRKSVPARKFRLVGGGEGRKREAISLIAAVKERKKRGNGTKTLHNHAVTPIKESSFPSNFSSLAAIFFLFFLFPRIQGKMDSGIFERGDHPREEA